MRVSRTRLNEVVCLRDAALKIIGERGMDGIIATVRGTSQHPDNRRADADAELRRRLVARQTPGLNRSNHPFAESPIHLLASQISRLARE